MDNKNKINIIKEINFTIIKKDEKPKEKEDDSNYINDRWNNKIKKERNKYFNFIKKINKDIFSYSEKKYIKDLIKNINMPKNKDNNLFYILHNYNSNNNDY